jgi:hypothetical protein
MGEGNASVECLSAGGRAAKGWSLHEPKPLYDHVPSWLSTWTEHAAWLDSPSTEHIVTTPPATDGRTFPPFQQGNLERDPCELATQHRLERVRSLTTG